ncbi:MAG: Gfo/Idh/MocA family oxidoreductase, partial [Planctomycetota bacterium]|nr:Gfo/Idh/MocA family oxidoreductase [Planctomycetota bacterium]
MLKAAVIGVGHLGRHHARILSEMDSVKLVAVVDPNKEQGQAIAESCNCNYQASLDGLEQQLDLAVIAVPTVLHEQCAAPLLDAKVACLIEKPFAPDPETCQRIIDRAAAAGAFVAVGHVERFNPAVKRAIELGIEAKFIEAHRLAPYSFRSTDVGVVLDLMIHDIDIILSLIDSPVKTIRASGLSILTDSVDIAHA